MAVPPAAISTDLLTPLGAYLRLRDEGRASFLLESVEQGRLGRHSFIGSGSRVVSFEEAEALGEPVVGYLAYDHVREARADRAAPGRRPRPAREPLRRRGHPRPLRPRQRHGDGARGRSGRDRAAAREELVLQRTQGPLAAGGPSVRPLSRRRPSTRPACGGSRSYIRAGDAFQVVLSQRAERPTSASALDLYRALRRVNPSPYLFLLELDGLALVGSSPETLVKCEDGRASLNPIAGTTHPGEGDAERLLASEKDRAEHVMLVDLGRNDLSRVCRAGSVHVERFLEPERFSHVTHLVSEVTGELRDGVTPFDLLRACFPAGTVSGAPKVRAMQIVSRARGLPPRARTRARSATRCRAARSTPASRSGRSSSPTASRGSRRARGSWQTPIRRPSTTSA